MIAGLLIIIIFPFIYFYTQMDNFNQKTDVIRTAINEGKETYIDPLTGKMHWTENGAVVSRIKLNMFWKPGDQNSLPGDEVIINLSTQKIYKNFSEEKYIAHIQNQKKSGKCWCGERKTFRDKGFLKDSFMKYHMRDKYFYKLSSNIIRESTYNKNGRYMFSNILILYCYIQIYDLIAKTYKDKKEIGYQEYKKLGGEYEVQDFVIRHIE